MNLGNLASILPHAIGLSLFVLIVKPLIVFIVLTRMKYSEYTAFQAAIATAQVSEFAFILLAMGTAKGLIGSDIAALGGLIGLLTIATSAYLVQYSEPIYQLARKSRLLAPFRAKQEADIENLKTCQERIVVIGMNALGRDIVKRLNERNERVLAIDTDPEKLKGLAPADTVIGNIEYQSVVEEIDLRNAKLVVSALQIEDTNQLIAYRCRFFKIPCVIHAFNVSVVDDLMDLDTAFLLMPSVDGILEQRKLMEREGILPG